MTPAREHHSYLPIQKWMKRQSTRLVMEVLTKQNAMPRFVGGCVRDALAGIRCPDNIDIATPIEPDEVIRLLKENNIRAIPTGLKHGTVTAVIDGHIFEVTTLRADIRTDGRHAIVRYTSDWEEDARRRDFTINSIYCDLRGKLYDPVGGLNDLREHRVRFIGDPEIRIKEDILRILRYFRFKAILDCHETDEVALSACRKFSPELKNLSGERKASELLKWLSAKNPGPSLAQSKAYGILTQLFSLSPAHTSLSDLNQLVKAEQTCGDTDPIRRFYMLTENKSHLEKMAKDLKFPNRVTRRLQELNQAIKTLPQRLTKAKARKIIYLNGKQTFIDLLLVAYAHIPDQRPNDWITLHRMANVWLPPKCPVGGADVMALGIPTGPLVGQLACKVENWWMENDFKPSRSAALDYLARLLNTP